MVHIQRTTPVLHPTTRSSGLPAGTAKLAPAQSFNQQVLDVGQQAMKALFGGSSTPVASPVTGGSANPVQNPAQTTAAVPPLAPAAASTAPNDPIAMLSSAMIAAGVDPTTMKMEYREQTITYPGGSYPLRLIQCNIAGRIAYIDADAMKVNPEIAALDLKWIQQHPYIGT